VIQGEYPSIGDSLHNKVKIEEGDIVCFVIVLNQKGKFKINI
jgi:hypothetical protein